MRHLYTITHLWKSRLCWSDSQLKLLSQCAHTNHLFVSIPTNYFIVLIPTIYFFVLIPIIYFFVPMPIIYLFVSYQSFIYFAHTNHLFIFAHTNHLFICAHTNHLFICVHTNHLLIYAITLKCQRLQCHNCCCYLSGLFLPKPFFHSSVSKGELRKLEKRKRIHDAVLVCVLEVENHCWLLSNQGWTTVPVGVTSGVDICPSRGNIRGGQLS